MSEIEGSPVDDETRERASSEVSRPTGVMVLAALYGLAAAVFALLTILTFVGALGSAGAGAGLFAGLSAVLAVVFLVMTVAAAAVAGGLWKRKRGAWFAAVGLDVIGVAGAIVLLFAGEVVQGVVSLLVAGIILWYLFTPTVQAWFGIGEPTTDRYGRPT